MIQNTALVNPRRGKKIRFGPYVFDNDMQRAQWEIEFELRLEQLNQVLAANVKGYCPVTFHFTQDPQIDEDSEEMEPMVPPPAEVAIANLRRWLSDRAASVELL